MEKKYFCRKSSEFQISELELSRTDCSYIKGMKPQALIRKARRGKRFLVGYIVEQLILQQRKLGVKRLNRDEKSKLYDKARKISARIYLKIDHAGYIRHDLYNYNNFDYLRGVLNYCKEISSSSIEETTRELRLYCHDCFVVGKRWEWISNIDELQHMLMIVLEETSYRTILSTTPKYETFDFNRIEQVSAQIVQAILPPRRKELYDYVSRYGIPGVIDGYKFARIFTAEEHALLYSIICDIVANADHIRKALLKCL